MTVLEVLVHARAKVAAGWTQRAFAPRRDPSRGGAAMIKPDALDAVLGRSRSGIPRDDLDPARPLAGLSRTQVEVLRMVALEDDAIKTDSEHTCLQLHTYDRLWETEQGIWFDGGNTPLTIYHLRAAAEALKGKGE